MSHEDADPDDAGLDAFRAAWRSMPDEDPPERGLADLLAAARVKAEEMAAPAPTWWERFTAFVRQQQVLALATIVVVVGGAVLIGRHNDTLKSAAPPVNALTPAPAMGSAATPPTGAIGHAPVETPTAPSKEAPALPKKDEPHAPLRKAAKASRGAMRPELEVAAPTESAVTNDALEQAPTAAQLHAQARQAAAANDCATALRLVAQIQRDDASYYSANVASDTSLKRCR